MMRESKIAQRSQPMPVPDYPIRCVECGAREVRPARISHELKKAHDGRLHALRIPDLSVTKCDKCGEIYFSNEADTQISAALRKKLRLLSPQQIRTERQALDLRQKDLADSLGIAVETISRWESGGLIQSRAMDNLLRVYFSLPQVRKVLGRGAALPANRGRSATRPRASTPPGKSARQQTRRRKSPSSRGTALRKALR